MCIFYVPNEKRDGSIKQKDVRYHPAIGPSAGRRRNTSDPVPVEDTNLTGSLVSIGASKRVGFPDSRDGKLLIGLSILVFWEE